MLANNNKTSELKGVSTLDVYKTRIVLLLLMVFSLGFVNQVSASRGHSILDRVDPKFNPRVASAAYGDKVVHYVKALPNGKTLVLGYFSSYNRIPVGRLVRLNADGSLDQTFDNQTINSTNVSGAKAKIVVQPDGKILIIAQDIVANGKLQKTLVRLNENGTLDTNFISVLNNIANDITIDAYGRVVVTGNFTTPYGTRYIVRINENGSIDNSFDFPSTNPADAGLIAAQGAKLIVGSSNSRIFRVNENGSIDPTFTPLLTTGQTVNSLMVQPHDHKILYLTDRLRRLNPHGNHDGTFQPVNIGGTEARLGADGKIIGLTSSNPTLKRYLSNGVVDPSFTPHTPVMMSCFEVQPDGRLLIGDITITNNSESSPNNFVELTDSGAPDPNFNAGGLGFQNIVPGSIRAIEAQSDGKVVFGGSFDLVNDVETVKIARLNADASVDTTFEINTSGTGNRFSVLKDIYQIRTQNDGKIVVSGSFDYIVNGVQKRNLVRLNTDGSIDTTFVLGHSMPDYSEIVQGGRNHFAILSDGKILVGTSKILGSESSGPIRLNPNGSVDTSFVPALHSQAAHVFVDDIVVQSDGKMIVSGSYRNPSSPFRSFVARLNADGSLDQTFTYSEELNRQRSTLSLQSDGKVLVSRHSDGDGPAKVLRLNSNGMNDSSFNHFTLEDAVFNSVLPLPDGSIFVSGEFSLTVELQTSRNLLLLGEDGTLNPTIYDLDGEVLGLELDDAGRVLVGGRFNIIGANGAGSGRSYIARLTDSQTEFDFDGDGKADVGIFRPSEGKWYISLSTGDLSVSQWGIATDKLVPADYDGDGRTDLAIYRNGQWWYFRSSDDKVVMNEWGGAEDIPMPSDFDGDGKDDLIFFRPSTGEWFRKGSTGVTDTLNFGTNGDIPLIGDFDGDRKSDPTIFRPATGMIWYLSSVTGLHHAHPIGQPGDVPVLGDYDGDGKTDPAVFRAGFWYISNSSDNSLTYKAWGFPDDHPAPADYDGDGRTDVAIYRPSNGMWFAIRSTQGFFSQQFGLGQDRAVANSFIF